jgi:hypothetical protein
VLSRQLRVDRMKKIVEYEIGAGVLLNMGSSS